MGFELSCVLRLLGPLWLPSCAQSVVCILALPSPVSELVLDSTEEDSFEALALKKGNQGGSL